MGTRPTSKTHSNEHCPNIPPPNPRYWMNLPFRESLQPWQKGSRGQWLLLIVKNALASFPLSRCYPYFLTIKLIASSRSISSIFSPRNAALLKPPALRYCQTFEVKWTPLYVKQCLWWGPNFGTCSQPNWNQSPEMVLKRSKFCPQFPPQILIDVIYVDSWTVDSGHVLVPFSPLMSTDHNID